MTQLCSFLKVDEICLLMADEDFPAASTSLSSAAFSSAVSGSPEPSFFITSSKRGSFSTYGVQTKRGQMPTLSLNCLKGSPR